MSVIEVHQEAGVALVTLNRPDAHNALNRELSEAIIATLLAYTLTGEEKYLRWHSLIHDWAYRFFPDPEYGEWYGYLHRDGRRSSSLKGNLWKGPFHLPRMQLLCWQMLAGLSSTDEASETAAE